MEVRLNFFENPGQKENFGSVLETANLGQKRCLRTSYSFPDNIPASERSTMLKADDQSARQHRSSGGLK